MLTNADRVVLGFCAIMFGMGIGIMVWGSRLECNERR
jgi:hypothetical protein